MATFKEICCRDGPVYTIALAMRLCGAVEVGLRCMLARSSPPVSQTQMGLCTFQSLQAARIKPQAKSKQKRTSRWSGFRLAYDLESLTLKYNQHTRGVECAAGDPQRSYCFWGGRCYAMHLEEPALAAGDPGAVGASAGAT
eukprot:4760246-Amphidinium_carterae.1